ncbi:MAG: TRAP transporter TatT component family protein [bacterium]
MKRRRGIAPGLRLLPFVALALIPAGGCSTSKLAVSAMTPVLQNTVDAALRSDDPRLVGDALPTSLLLLDGMMETDRGNREIVRLSSMLHFAYAFAWVEEPERASRYYARGRDLGWRALGRPEVQVAVTAGPLKELPAALAKLKQDDAESLVWIAANWAQWIELHLEDTSAVADISRLMPLTDRLVELDETIFWGMPRILAGALQASRPITLGGNPDRARAEFDRALEISDRNLLLAQVFEAKTLAVQTFDGESFQSSLREVLEAAPGQLPEAELLNRIARIKAEELLARYEDIFE